MGSWVLLYGAIILYLMPRAHAWTGMTGILLFFAALPVLALPLVKVFPKRGTPSTAVEADAEDLPGAIKGLAIGPALAASVITPIHYARVNWLAIGFFALSWVCILPPGLIQQRRAMLRLLIRGNV